MGCPVILSGENFLATAMSHLDCQGRTIGFYGYLELAQPGSQIAVALNGLLTLFVAFFGLRLMFGRVHDGADVVGAVVRIGIVITLTTSWPAWRTLGYDVVMQGPVDIAAEISRSSGLAGYDRGLSERLQNADNGIVAITSAGTGRLTGEGGGGGQDPGDSFKGIAMPDYSALGWGRVAFLVGAIGPYAMVRIGAGILLAVAPLMAALLLFANTSVLFFGWVRGLVFCALGNLGFMVVQSAQLAIMEPWLADILRARGGNAFTPSAPTELLVIALAFCLTILGFMLLIGWISFLPGVSAFRLARAFTSPAINMVLAHNPPPPTETPARPILTENRARARGIADSVAATMRREDAAAIGQSAGRANAGSERLPAATTLVVATSASRGSLGDSFRRSRRRTSSTANKREV